MDSVLKAGDLTLEETGIREAAKEYTHLQFSIKEGENLLMDMGLYLWSVIDQKYYVWLTPTTKLKAKHGRSIRVLFKKLAHGSTIVAGVPETDKKALRFIEFFGFRRVATANGVVNFERTY